MKSNLTVRFASLAICLLPFGLANADPFPVTIRVQASETKGELKPAWRFFGTDEPNYGTTPNGKKLLAELGEMAPKRVFFRAHNLLCTGDGTPALKWGSTNAYTEDANGNPIYDWKILDEIFDAYRDANVRPYTQIGFMPKALSTNPEPYQHNWRPGGTNNRLFTGWAYPPKDHKKWEDLVYEWVKHCVERYGKEEVETWYWQVWNEADIGYWQGQPKDETFHRLHDHAINGVKRALPTAKVGGPDAASGGSAFMRNFLDHCLNGTNYATGQKGTPMDFVAFHAKGQPSLVEGNVRLAIGNHLNNVNNGYRTIAAFPELKNTPIVIGESDPDTCAACRAIEYPANAYRNRPHFASYTAASYARKYDLADQHGLNLEGILAWTFQFDDQPYFAGLRALATNGIDLPVMNAFRMFAKMSGDRIAVDSSHGYLLDELLQSGRRGAAPPAAESEGRGQRRGRGRGGVRVEPDVSAMASIDGNKLMAIVWHYHDDDIPGDEAAVTLTFTGLPQQSGQAKLQHFRIDDEHSNSFTVWKEMGEPQQPTPEQYAQLEKAGKLAELEAPSTVNIENGQATIIFALPRQGVSLLVLEMNAK